MVLKLETWQDGPISLWMWSSPTIPLDKNWLTHPVDEMEYEEYPYFYFYSYDD